jgi:general nucleoside transport system ATP-binding protein
MRTTENRRSGIEEVSIPLPLFNVDVSSALGISYAHQDPVQIRSVSVADNLTLHRRHLKRPIRLFGPSRAMVRQRVAELARETGLEIDNLFNADQDSLDVGDRQRLELARAFLDVKPGEILLLDEPTTHISNTEKASLVSYLNILKAKGVGVILVTHEPLVFLACADRGTIFQSGVVVFSGRTGDQAFRDAALAASTPRELLVAIGTNPEIAFALAVERRVGKERQEVDIVLRKGDVATLVDPDTEALGDLFNYLLGDTSSWRRIGNDRHNRDGGARLAFVGADRIRDNLFSDMSIFENAVCRERCGFRTFGKGNREVAASILNELGKKVEPHVFRTKAATLSGGEKQKLIIARQLFDHPECLVLREPGHGLDRANLDMVMSQLFEFSKAGGCALILGAVGGGYDSVGRSLTMKHEIVGMRREINPA